MAEKIGTITNFKNRDSCRDLFKNLKIFIFVSQYIFSLLSFVITNTDQYITNSNIHGCSTRHGAYFHQTISNLFLYQRGFNHTGLGFLTVSLLI